MRTSILVGNPNQWNGSVSVVLDRIQVQMSFLVDKTCSESTIRTSEPLHTVCKLSVHKTLCRHAGRLLKVVGTLRLRPVLLGGHCVKRTHG